MKTPTSHVRLPQFASRLLCTPWHMSEERGRTTLAAMLNRLRNERPEEDIWGDPLPKMQIVGDVAIIPLVGTLMVNVPDWMKRYGLGVTDANDVAEELDRALNDPAVEFIVQDVDSGGGESIAGGKLFDLFEAARRKKPVFSFCADGATMASAAYEAAAPATAIYIAPYSCVGSIGSYLAFLDDTEYWKMLGFTWEVFRSGELKGIGEDKITDKQRAFLQDLTDSCGRDFRKRVAKYRTEVAEEDMNGAWWFGREAATRGFAAGTAKDLSAAIAKFRGML